MKKVLIIEDDQIVGTVYERFLRAHGFEVEIARDGAAGLEQIPVFQPDAVLLDLMMPKMGGLEVLRRIRLEDAWRELPVIVMTAANLPAFTEQAAAIGATRIFDKANHKPLAVTELLHDLLHTTSDASLISISKSGNPDAVLENWPD